MKDEHGHLTKQVRQKHGKEICDTVWGVEGEGRNDDYRLS